MALMSGKVYSNTGAPSNADGIDGDIYMQLDGFKTTYRKESGSWVAVGSTLGAIPEFISGVGVPSNLLGEDGQYYRNSVNQDIFYKQGGLWANVGNLTGAAFIPLLEQAGIGKDLGTAPNFVNGGSADDILTVGEYYVSGVTELPLGVGAGFLKVWRIDANNVGQILQRTIGGSSTQLHFRLSVGGVFTAWETYAQPTLATTTVLGLVEKATQVELNTGINNVWPDAATLLNGFDFSANPTGFIVLPEWLGGLTIQWGYNNSTNNPETIIFQKPLMVCYTVLATPNALTSLDSENVMLANVTPLSFDWNGARDNASNYVNGWWLAIGK